MFVGRRFGKNHAVDSEFSKGTRIHKHTQTHLSNIRREALEAKLQKELPHTAKYITHPWADFPWSRSPQIGSVPKKWAFESSRRELAFRRRIVRYWRPLGRRAIEPGKQPQGGGCIPSYIVLLYTTCLPGVSCKSTTLMHMFDGGALWENRWVDLQANRCAKLNAICLPIKCLEG